jgi:hypothetical protein
MVVAPPAYILPLCSIEQVRAELEDTDNKIRRALDRPVVNAEKRDEYMAVLHRWQGRLKAQLEDMAERATNTNEGTHHA